jgi:hypothetical protein
MDMAIKDQNKQQIVRAQKNHQSNRFVEVDYRKIKLS